MNDQPKKSGRPAPRISLLSVSIGLFVFFGILRMFNPFALYGWLQFGCGLMALILFMTKKGTSKENKESASPELATLRKKILNFLGMLIFLGLAFLMGSLSYGEIREPFNNPIGAGVLGLMSLGLGCATFLFGYRVWAPVARQGWIKSKLRNTAVISLACALLILINIPHHYHYRNYRFNSQAKSNLHYMFQACQAYWKQKSTDKVCDQKIASQGGFGFIPSKFVSISGKGKAANFTGTAQHEKSSKVFTIDAEGKITQVESQ